MNSIEHIIAESASKSQSRLELWTRLLQIEKVRRVAEIGVYKGDFAAKILRECDSIEAYYMIDPWRHLADWNKPANKTDSVFEEFLRETKEKTAFAAEKRTILRGKTTEVIEKISDGELDFAYIDGDHTLKGITIDLISILPKIKLGGWIGGDDFSPRVWQHGAKFEPTLVFPFAVYFAEAIGARIYALPFNQFLMHKTAARDYEFLDATKRYSDTSLLGQFRPSKILRLVYRDAVRFLRRLPRK
jgi:hypothetical protein